MLGKAALFAAIWLLPCFATAYVPHAGDRAQNFYGRDIVGERVVHLEDFLGTWTWVEFWSSS